MGGVAESGKSGTMAPHHASWRRYIHPLMQAWLMPIVVAHILDALTAEQKAARQSHRAPGQGHRV